MNVLGMTDLAELMASATRHLRAQRPAAHGRVARVLSGAPVADIAGFHVDRLGCGGCRGEREPLGFRVRRASDVRRQDAALGASVGPAVQR